MLHLHLRTRDRRDILPRLAMQAHRRGLELVHLRLDRDEENGFVDVFLSLMSGETCQSRIQALFQNLPDVCFVQTICREECNRCNLCS